MKEFFKKFFLPKPMGYRISHGTNYSSIDIYTPEMEKKYIELIRFIVRQTLLHGKVPIDELVEAAKNKVDPPAKGLVSEALFEKADTQICINKMRNIGIIKINCGFPKRSNYIGGRNCQYSLTPYAVHWLSVVDIENDQYIYAMRISVISLLVSVISLLVSMAVFILTSKTFLMAKHMSVAP